MSDWPTATSAEHSAAEKKAARDREIKAWLDAKAVFENAKTYEMTLRKKVTALVFPEPKKGTQRCPLSGGYALKLVQNYVPNLGVEVYDDNNEKISVATQVENVLAEIDNLGEVAEIIANRLVKWKPELSMTEYKQLDLEDPVQAKIKELIDEILTLAPASPQLELEAPKQNG